MREGARQRQNASGSLRNVHSRQAALRPSTVKSQHQTKSAGRLVAAFPALFIFIALIFGGSTKFGLWPNAALELASVAFLLVVAFTSRDVSWLTKATDLLALLVLIVAIGGLHLVPLPASIWSAFPGRSFVAEGYRLLGGELPASPLSLDSTRAKESALSVFPVICAVILVLRAGRTGYLPLAIVTAATAILSIILGIAQMLSGDAGLYLYSEEPLRVATGFFANENHLATLILISIPLMAAAYLEVRDQERHSSKRPQIFILLGLVVFFSVGVLIAGSVAGVLLLLPALVLSGAMIFFGKLKGGFLPLLVGATVIIVASSALVLTSENARSLETSLGSEKLDRLGIARSGFELAKVYWPVGSGLASFEASYKLHEDLETISSVYVNHAHNDYLELIIEFGLLGLLLIALLALYWAKWSYLAWAGPEGDRHWRQAASISILIVALHSLIDYPARTLAILVLLSCCFAILRYIPGANQNDAEAKRAC